MNIYSEYTLIYNKIYAMVHICGMIGGKCGHILSMKNEGTGAARSLIRLLILSGVSISGQRQALVCNRPSATSSRVTLLR